MDELSRYKRIAEAARKELQDIKDERKKGVENRKATLQANLDRGKIITKNAPSWLSTDDAKKEWFVLPEQVLIVQRIFKLASRGLSPLVIANRLTETNTPTLVSASAWDDALVLSVMRNPAVIGELRAKDGTVLKADYYPAIVKPEIFALVQEHIALRKGSGGTSITEITTLFSGLLKCQCGSPMRYVAQSGKTQPYVVCRKAYSSKTCKGERLPYQPLEDQLMRWICEDQQFDMRVNYPVADDRRGMIIRQLLPLKRELRSIEQNLLKGEHVALIINDSLGKLKAKIAELEHEFEITPPKFIRTGSAETLKLWKEHNQSTGQKRVIYRLRLQAAVRTIIRTIEVWIKTHDKNGVSTRRVTLYGPVFNLATVNKSEVGSFEQETASERYDQSGVNFDLKLG